MFTKNFKNTFSKVSSFSKFFSQKPINILKLRNGNEVPEPIAISTMMNLNLLMEKDPIAFFELVAKCKNSQHKMWGKTEKTVSDFGLINSGSVHECIRDVVLSAVQGEGIEMVLGSPLEENYVSNRMNKE